LKKILEQGGQQALVNAIRGGGQGQIKLGALSYPVDLVMVEKIDDGWLSRDDIAALRRHRWSGCSE
jgi:hypothetical protein